MATCLGYAVSDNPLTGFKYGGVIIDNIGCDPGTWNNHGSLCCFKGQWYIFYHRSTHGFEFSRHVCVEPITVRDGKIDEVMMTSSGVGESLQASQILPGSWACGLSGNVRIMGQGRTVADSGEYPMILTCIRPGDTASFRYLAFNGETGFHATFSSDGPCHITVLIDGSPVAVTDVHGYANLIQSVFGRHEITLLFDGAFTETSLVKIQFM